MATNEFILEVIERNQNPVRTKTKCVNCGRVPVFIEHGGPVCPGHIYSALGKREFGISQLCEYCFDEITEEYEEGDDVEGE